MSFMFFSIIWSISLLIFFTIVVRMFIDWVCIKDSTLNEKTKVILGIVAIVSLTAILISQHHLSNPNADRKNEAVSITQISEVYKSNIDAEGNEDDSCYYVIKEDDTRLYEIVVEKIVQGDGNYIITKKYSNGEIIHELVLKNKESIKTLPNYDK